VDELVRGALYVLHERVHAVSSRYRDPERPPGDMEAAEGKPILGGLPKLKMRMQPWMLAAAPSSACHDNGALPASGHAPSPKPDIFLFVGVYCKESSLSQRGSRS